MSQQPPTRLPLIATPENRGEATDTDAKLVNGYVEKTAMGDVWCYKRPGLTLSSTISSGGRIAGGILAWEDHVYSIFGDKIYRDTTLVDTIDGLEEPGYTFSANLAATPQLFFHNSASAYFLTAAAASVTVVGALAALPAFVPGSVYLDGTTYVMTEDNYIRGSAINDVTAWDALNVIRAQMGAGKGVAIAKQLSYLIAFKEFSTEVFYDAQNAAGSPLGRVEGAHFNHGCYAGSSVVEVDNAIFYLGQSLSGVVNVMKLEALKPEPISTPAVERILQANFGSTFVRATKFYTGGHKFVAFTSTTAGVTLVYDIGETIWYQWTGSTGGFFNFVSSTKNGSSPVVGQGYSDGAVYTIDSEAFSDYNGAFTFDLVTPIWDGGSRLKKMTNLLEVVADQKGAGVLQLRYTDDDYKTWSNWLTLDLSQERPMISNLGTTRKRAYQFRHTGSQRFRLKSVDMHVDLGML